MSNYTKATNFAAKDSLPSGNSGKIIKGTEIDNEYTAIASAIASKADTNSPTFTGTPLAPTAASGTNSTQIATTAFVASAITAATGEFPSGGIIMWSGSVANIPAGWVLCNGSNSTPDLRNKFILGAGSTYAVGATGGSKDAIVVSHTHSFSGSTGSAGSHTHGAWSNSNDESNGVRAFNRSTAMSVGALGGNASTAYVTQLAGASTDAFSTAPDHTHSVTGTVATTGSSATDANLPPYYALCFIMKT
jgi:hypothetical protein